MIRHYTVFRMLRVSLALARALPRYLLLLARDRTRFPSTQRHWDRAHGVAAREFRRVALSLAGGFTKAAQIGGARADILPAPFIDESGNGHSPDGAVTDAEGNIWVSHWGSSRVAIYDTTGTYISEIGLPATQVTCPAFGGPDLTTLYVTSAMVSLSEEEVTAHVGHGRTFRIADAGRGKPEPQVVL